MSFVNQLLKQGGGCTDIETRTCVERKLPFLASPCTFIRLHDLDMLFGNCLPVALYANYIFLNSCRLLLLWVKCITIRSFVIYLSL